MYKAVIFDLDGVIINTEKVYQKFARNVAAEVGLVLPPEYFAQYVGKTDKTMWEETTKMYNIQESVDELLRIHKEHKQELFSMDLNPLAVPHVESLLKKLSSKGVPIGLASSSKKKTILHILEKLDLFQYFAAAVSGNDMPHNKPAPDAYLECARLLAMEPKHCIVIEDSPTGIQAAKSAGMYVIGYKNPVSPLKEELNADTVIASIKDFDLNLIST